MESDEDKKKAGRSAMAMPRAWNTDARMSSPVLSCAGHCHIFSSSWPPKKFVSCKKFGFQAHGLTKQFFPW